ncbi:MAG: cyclic lactone autoinducer peptide [Clostridiales bacterium]|nr:cyclic lactone autoinducer peptide [Clostridiales bacterium]
MKIKNFIAKYLSNFLLLVSIVVLNDNSWLFLGEAKPPKDVLDNNSKF